MFDSLVSRFIGLFISHQGDWKMVKIFDLIEKLKIVSKSRVSAYAFYLYKDPAYCTVYDIIEPYKNYLRRP